MKVKKLSREKIIRLEKVVENGVYVSPVKMSKRQETKTKALIEEMKKSIK